MTTRNGGFGGVVVKNYVWKRKQLARPDNNKQHRNRDEGLMETLNTPTQERQREQNSIQNNKTLCVYECPTEHFLYKFLKRLTEVLTCTSMLIRSNGPGFGSNRTEPNR